jgi:hypothetical protein
MRNPITAAISVESARLREKWKLFYNHCPPEERVDLQNSEPTLEGVVDMVNKMMQAWQAKREKSRGGRAMAGFHRFCGSLNSHSNLIKLLPEGNEYVSVFTGTLNAIIKVRMFLNDTMKCSHGIRLV